MALKTQQFYPILYIIFIMNWSCKAQEVNDSQGIIKGTIGLFEGNCMPGPGVPPCEPKPVIATLYFTNPSETFSPNILIDSVSSTENGTYSVTLKEGTYSTFIKYQGEIICTGLICDGECICSPVIVEHSKETLLNLNIDKATW